MGQSFSRERVTRTTGPSLLDRPFPWGWLGPAEICCLCATPTPERCQQDFSLYENPIWYMGFEHRKRPLFCGHQFQSPYFTVDFERKAPASNPGHASFREQNANPFPLTVQLFSKLFLLHEIRRNFSVCKSNLS